MFDCFKNPTNYLAQILRDGFTGKIYVNQDASLAYFIAFDGYDWEVEWACEYTSPSHRFGCVFVTTNVTHHSIKDHYDVIRSIKEQGYAELRLIGGPTVVR